MKVKELKEELAKFPDDFNVVMMVEDYDGNYIGGNIRAIGNHKRNVYLNEKP